MPRYDYRCNKCKQLFEDTLPITESAQSLCSCGGVGHKVYITMPGVKYSGGGWASKQYTTEDEKVMNRIRSAAATDADIGYVNEKGTSDMKNEMKKVADKLHKEKKDIERVYGEGFADGKDRNGNYVKVMDVNI